MNKSILEVVHESAKDMNKSGHIDKVTMREYDSLCLPEVKQYSAAQIRNIRINNKASQAVFAKYLNTGVESVRKWEAKGDTRKQPNGTALKLISLVEAHGLEILETP